MSHRALELVELVLIVAAAVAPLACDVEDEPASPSERLERDEPVGEPAMLPASLVRQLEQDPTFDTTIRMLADEGLVPLWDDVTTVSDHVWQVPLVPTEDDAHPAPDLLVIERDEQGGLRILTEDVDFEPVAPIDEYRAPTDAQPKLPCDIGAYMYDSSCGIVSVDGECDNDGMKVPHYVKQHYDLDYYENGRIKALAPYVTTYSCTPIGSDPYCSSMCYEGPIK